MVLKPLSRLAVPALGIGLVAGLCGVGAAQADPKTTKVDTVAEARKQVDALEAESSKLDSEYSRMDQQLTQANARLKALDSQVRGQQDKVAKMKSSLGGLAVMQYQSSGLSVPARLVTSTNDAATLTQLTTVQNLNNNVNNRLQDLQLEQARLTTLQADVQANKDQAEQARKNQGTLKEQYGKKLAEAKKVLDSLTAAERQRLAAEREREAAKQQAASQPEALTSTNSKSSKSSSTKSTSSSSASTKDSSSATSNPTVSPGAEGAVAYARAQVGKPYVMGATGPNAFDCSGLTSAAWRAAGVSIPRTSQEQAGAGVPVSRADIQPGDLIIFYGGASHVGIYVGGGMMVDAGNPSTGVRLKSLSGSYMPINQIRRVG